MGQTSKSLISRKVLPLIGERIQDESVIILEGPRSVGKSTVLRAIAKDAGVEVLDLDDLATREAVERDPAIFYLRLRLS